MSSRWWYWAFGVPALAALWALSALWTWLGVVAAGVDVGTVSGLDYVALPLAVVGVPLTVAVVGLPVAIRLDTADGGPAVPDRTPYEYGAWAAVGIGVVTAVAAALVPAGRVTVLVFGVGVLTVVDTAVSLAYLRERAAASGLRPLPTRSA